MKTIIAKQITNLICIVALLFFATSHLYGQQYCFNTQVRPLANQGSSNDDTTFELFKSTTGGSACMNILSVGSTQKKVDGAWSGNIDNVLIRESKRQSPATNDQLNYSISLSRMDNNVYHGAYGWSRNGNINNNSFRNGARNGVIEWYIVQGYNDKRNPTFDMTKADGTYTDAGGTYEVWYKDISNQGSVYANVVNFTQIKCVRTSSVARTSSRTLNLQTHFDNMISKTSITSIGTLFESSYSVEGFGSTSRATFSLDVKFSSASSSNNDCCNWPEISPGKYIFSSGIYNNNNAYSAANANDNNQYSRYASSRNVSNTYLAYDLYQHYYIKKIKVYFDAAYAYGLRIWIDNGRGWYYLKDVNVGYYTMEIPIETTARRISIQSLGSPYDHISIREFDVFGNYQYGKGTQQEKTEVNQNPVPESALTYSSSDLIERALRVFPNPATDNFSINIVGMKKADITITDLLGKTIYKTTTKNSNLELRKSSLFESGLYIITAKDEFDKTYTSKLIIK